MSDLTFKEVRNKKNQPSYLLYDGNTQTELKVYQKKPPNWSVEYGQDYVISIFTSLVTAKCFAKDWYRLMTQIEDLN